MAQAGRPSEYKPEYCEQLIDHCSLGLSVESFAGKLKKSRATIYNWRDEFAEFKEACEIAETCCLLFWETTGVNGLQETKSFNPQTGETYTHKLNSAVWIFNMKARFKKFGWSEKIEVSGDQDKPIQLKYNVTDQPPTHPGLSIVATIEAKAANE